MILTLDDLSRYAGIVNIFNQENSDSKPRGLSTDSRTIEQGQIFLALVGEKFDGRNFIEKALKNGASTIIYPSLNDFDLIKPLIEKNSQICFIEVKDSLEYLQWIGRETVNAWRTPKKRVLCITGSNGKTTTKEMAFHLLDSVSPGKIHKNHLNFNNHIGVPLTLINLKHEHEIAVVEIGTNHPGEIALLSEISDPDYGIITMVGESHLEFLIDKEGVYREKTALFRYIDQHKKEDGFYLINGLDEYLKEYCGEANSIKIGTSECQLEFGKQVIHIKLSDQEEFSLKNNELMGNHNFLNLAQAFLISRKLCPGNEEILLKAASDFITDNNRSTWTRWKDKKVFLDAYNANPSSMRASLQEFNQWVLDNGVEKSEVCLVLGDMLELGPESSNYHRELGELVYGLGYESVIYFGSFAQDFQTGYKFKTLRSFKNVEQLEEFSDLVSGKEVLFLKASRGLHLETLIR